MSRTTRRDPPGAFHFITNRGTAQTAIYRTDGDRRFFLWLLSELEVRFGVRILAYVLMGNHYHVIVQSSSGRLSEAMHFLDGSHARRFNAAHGRSGALFQGRYDDRLITTDAHFERAGLYLHLNPQRAGLVRRAVDFPWSSLGAHAAGRAPVSWLRLDLLAERTGEQYIAAVAAAIGDVLELDSTSDDCIHAWCSEADASVDASFRSSDAAVAAAFGASVDEFYIVVRGRANVARMAAIAHAAATTGQPLDEVARRYGLRTADSVQSAIRRLRLRAVDDHSIAARLESLGLGLRLAG